MLPAALDVGISSHAVCATAWMSVPLCCLSSSMPVFKPYYLFYYRLLGFLQIVSDYWLGGGGGRLPEISSGLISFSQSSQHHARHTVGTQQVLIVIDLGSLLRVGVIRGCDTQPTCSGEWVDRAQHCLALSRSGVHVGSLHGVGGAEDRGDRVVSVTWRKPSGEVTLDGESGWQEQVWWVS